MMDKIKAVLIALLVCVISVTAQAEQAQLISQKEANQALAFLNTENVHVIKKFCLPCGELAPQNIVIETVSIRDGNYKGLWEVVINGEALDLAYAYVPTQSRWKNFARVVDIYVDDMPRYLDELSNDTKIADSKGWYINDSPKIVMTKEINYGSVAALLGRGEYAKLSIFFKGADQIGCDDAETPNEQSNPMYINDTLVRFSLVCKGNSMVFYADTEEGNTFVLEQFLQQNFVKVKPYSGQESFLFSTKGFKTLYNKVMGLAP
jgi:hypothetical protein